MPSRNLSKANAAEIEAVGATPFIAFRANTVTPQPGSAWARMWAFCEYRRTDFLDRYHKRSNVERAFGMIKAKFGDRLLSKTEVAMANEVLAKVVAHNLCVLIQAFYELGVEADFETAA